MNFKSKILAAVIASTLSFQVWSDNTPQPEMKTLQQFSHQIIIAYACKNVVEDPATHKKADEMIADWKKTYERYIMLTGQGGVNLIQGYLDIEKNRFNQSAVYHGVAEWSYLCGVANMSRPLFGEKFKEYLVVLEAYAKEQRK